MIRKVWRMEWDAWASRKDVRWAVVFLLVATVLYALLVRALVENDLLANLAVVIPGDAATGFGLAYATTAAMMRLLGLFLLLWASASIAGELERGTLRLPLLRIPRRAMPWGKASFLAAGAAVLGLAMLGLAWGVGAAFYGLDGVYANEVMLHGRLALLRAGVVATVLTLLPLSSGIALAICVSCLVRSAQHALTLTLALGLALWAVSWLPGVGPWVFPSTLSWPFDVAASQSEGLKTLTFTRGLGQHLLVNLLWIAGPLALAQIRFERRDLTV